MAVTSRLPPRTQREVLMHQSYRCLAFFLCFVTPALLTAVPLKEKAPAEVEFTVPFLSRMDISKALPALEAIPTSSPYFAWALLERARILYRAERWSEFFGTTYYLRLRFPESSQAVSAQLLETLGLMRHCHWDEARSLWRETSGKSTVRLTAIRDALGEWLSSGPGADLPEIGLRDPHPDRSREQNHLLPLSLLWKLPAPLALTIRVERLRRKVTPQCRPGKETNAGSEGN